MITLMGVKNVQGGRIVLVLSRGLSSVGSGSGSGTTVGKEDIKNLAPTSFNPESFPSPEVLSLKRGTGGRSSFNGIVCTVFGSSGALGGNVVSRLGQTGTQIIVPYRGNPHYVKHLKLSGDLGQVLFQPFYLRDEESIYRCVKYSNVVVNCIGKENETPSFTFDDVHVEGARKIARIAREAGVKRFIHVSALNATPNPKPIVTRYGCQFLRSKYFGELAVREEFPNAVIFRPADMWGLCDHFLTYYANWYRRSFYRKIALWKMGKGVFKMPVWDSDVAEGIVNAIQDKNVDGKVVECIGPKKYELHDIVKHVNQCIQKDEYHGWHEICDMRFDIQFWLKVYLTEQLRKYPLICWDKVEREQVTDMLTPGNWTLQDVGVKTTCMEDKARAFLWPFIRFGFYSDELGEKPLPDPLKSYPLDYA